MVALLFIALVIFCITGIGLYFWQRSAPRKTEQAVPPPPDFRGLFEEGTPSGREAMLKLAAAAADEKRSALIARARNGEKVALREAKETADALSTIGC